MVSRKLLNREIFPYENKHKIMKTYRIKTSIELLEKTILKKKLEFLKKDLLDRRLILVKS